MAGRKLLDSELTRGLRQVLAQIGFEPGEVEFLARANGARFIENVCHGGLRVVSICAGRGVSASRLRDF